LTSVSIGHPGLPNEKGYAYNQPTKKYAYLVRAILAISQGEHRLFIFLSWRVHGDWPISTCPDGFWDNFYLDPHISFA
jgi:hypothetical protein